VPASFEGEPFPPGTPGKSANKSSSGTTDADVFGAFDDWSARYLSGSPEERKALAIEGKRLAAARRKVLARLIESDPEQALAKAVAMRLRQELPDSVVEQLEERVNDRGDFEVLGILGDSGTSIRRFVRTDERKYEAFVYGRRLQQASKVNIPVHGIALANELALDEKPGRVLEPGEIPDPELLAQAASECPISKKSVAAPVLVQVGKTLHKLCHAGHIESLLEELQQAEAGPGPDLLEASTWTQGAKTLLYIRVNFPDDPTEPITEAGAYAAATNINDFFVENSYGTTSLIPTVTPLLSLPRTKSSYSSVDDFDGLLSDARSAAAAAGYNTANYSWYCVQFKAIFSGWSGMAYVGAKGVWLQSTSPGVACHELGHNYGLSHANFWSTTDGSVIGAGANQEYGNTYDTMGSANGGIYQFNTCHKSRLGWLPSTAIQTVTSNGVYRIYPFDVPSLELGLKYALKIHKDTRDYWVEMRQKFTGNTSLQNGVLLLWSPWAQSNGGSELLDTTPGSAGGKSDAALQIGRTFEDTAAAIQITPVTSGSSPKWIEVQVTLNASSSNALPVVSIAASDPNASETGPDPGAFTVSRTGATSASLIVHYTVSGTAAATTDYTSLSGTVTIPSGAVSATIPVSPINDLTVETSETVIATLSANAAYVLNPTSSSATVTIADNDLPAISIGDVAVVEGNSGSVTAAFVVTLSAPSSLPVTVHFATADGTARAGKDYLSASGLLTIGAGLTNSGLTVSVMGDTAVESNETFFVNLTGATNATIGVGQGRCTITNDDVPIPSTSLRIASTPDNRAIALTIISHVGAKLTVESTTNLTVWTTLANVTNLAGTMQYLDPRKPGETRRFYRTRE
jgi:hypothetical protein